MYSFTMSDAGVSDDAWNWLCATREIRVAIDALEEVAAAFSGLRHDTRWEAEGVRALRGLLDSLLAASQSEIGDLHTRSAELDRMIAP